MQDVRSDVKDYTYIYIYIYIYCGREALAGRVDERSHCFLSAALDQSVVIHGLETRRESRSSASNET
jgi:hypothetical protein